MVLLDADPTDNVRSVARIRGVVIDGRFFDRLQLDQMLATAKRMAQTA
jgi:hypothetical protein